jgi:hypothetical protein
MGRNIKEKVLVANEVILQLARQGYGYIEYDSTWMRDVYVAN